MRTSIADTASKFQSRKKKISTKSYQCRSLHFHWDYISIDIRWWASRNLCPEQDKQPVAPVTPAQHPARCDAPAFWVHCWNIPRLLFSTVLCYLLPWSTEKASIHTALEDNYFPFFQNIYPFLKHILSLFQLLGDNQQQDASHKLAWNICTHYCWEILRHKPQQARDEDAPAHKGCPNRVLHLLVQPKTNFRLFIIAPHNAE